MLYTDRFAEVPVIKYVEVGFEVNNDTGKKEKVFDEITKHIKVDPREIECYESVVASHGGMDIAQFDGEDQVFTVFRLRSGNIFTTRLTISEFENLLNEHCKSRYQ